MKRAHVLFLVCLVATAVVLVIGTPSAQAKRGWWGIASDAGGSWANQTTTVTISTYGKAPAGTIQYSTDSGASWVSGGTVTIAAMADHSNDGVHDVDYRFVDASESVLRSGFCQVRIDTTKPDVFSANATCVSGTMCRFRFLIVDIVPQANVPPQQSPQLSPTAQATLVIWKWVRVKGQWVMDVYRTIEMGRQQTNVFPEESWVFYDWSCDLPAGDYWYRIDAVDEAGNPHNHTDHSSLTVTAS